MAASFRTVHPRRQGARGVLLAGVLALLTGRGPECLAQPVLRVGPLPASLAGPWEFAPGDPPGGVSELDTLPFRLVPVPGSWQDAGISEHGIGWYRVTLDLDPVLTDVPLAFVCPQIRDADEVYLDGKLVGRTGSFPPHYDKGTLVARAYELPPSRTAVPGRHVLAVRVYNAGPRPGGITGAPELDSVAQAFQNRVVREGPRALLATAFGALGLFSLFAFLRDRSQKDFLWFFLASEAGAATSASWLSIWTLTWLPLSIPFRVGLAGIFVLPGLTVLLFNGFFARPASRLHRVLLGLLAAAALTCLLWPRVDDLYSILPAAFLLVAVAWVDLVVFLVAAARKRAPWAAALLAAMVVLAVSSLGTMLSALGFNVAPLADLPLAGPAYFLLMATFLAALADRIARLRLLASTDPLTSLANRAVLFDRINLEIARARRHGHPVALALLDIDHFKGFNDRFGHVAGDRFLVGVAKAISAGIRDTDLAARFGGEEFVVLLPETDLSHAIACLERIRVAVADVRVAGAAEGGTISAGVAVFDPAVRATVSVSAWLRQADAALYQSKAAGRNRVMASRGAPPSSSTSENLALGAARRGAKP